MSSVATTFTSACPHDCPSTCALEVERGPDDTVTSVRGAKHNSYTAGVICSKVARYAERLYHPNRLTRPLKRTGTKGDDDFTPITSLTLGRNKFELRVLATFVV